MTKHFQTEILSFILILYFSLICVIDRKIYRVDPTPRLSLVMLAPLQIQVQGHKWIIDF